LNSDWLSRGPKTERFERLIAEYVRAPHAVAVSSCTAGLQVALAALEVGPGDEVITCAMTFPSTANVVVHQGARPVFVDARADTLNMDPTLLEARITPRTRAAIVVHFAGQIADMPAIDPILRHANVPVIEDAAHAVGATLDNRHAGTLGALGVFSFYATKNLTTGDGGMIITADDALATAARVLSLHGMSTGAWNRYSAQGNPSWSIERPGFKCNMTDLQASIGIHQLAKLEGFITRREELVAGYDALLGGIEGLAIPRTLPGRRHAHHLYTILLPLERLRISRDEFAQALKQYNIGTGIHFVGVHLQPYYARTYGLRPSDFPVATWISERVLSLPLFPTMAIEDVDYVGAVVQELLQRHER
jgi:dTDP-4-amino-4,6-dideoxygalactose transaminase